MLQCPKCERSFSTFTFTGWVVNATGSAQVGDDGKVEQAGALVTRCSVKPGHEFEGAHVLIACPYCGHEGQFKTFPQVFQCFVSGENADDVINHKTLGRLHYASKYRDVALSVVDDELIDWEQGKLTNAALSLVTNGLKRRA